MATTDRSALHSQTAALKDKYIALRDAATKELDQLRGHVLRLMLGRSAAFLIGVVLFSAGWWAPGPWWLWWALAVVAGGGFQALVQMHARSSRKQTWLRDRRRIINWQLARIDRNWKETPHRTAPLPEGADQSTAADLNITGRASLFQLVNQANTPAGEALLCAWLVDAPGDVAADVKLRQQAVQQLAPDIELRQHVQASGLPLRREDADPEAFVKWTRQQPWLLDKAWLVWLARLLPVVTIALLVAGQVGVVPGLIWLAPALLAAGVSFAMSGRAHAIFNEISSRHGETRRCVTIFEAIENMQHDAELLAGIRETISHNHGAAARELKKISFLIDLAEVRYSPMLYLPLQMIFMWDFHVLGALENWRKAAGDAPAEWFEALAEFEALSSLAGLAHDNPDWCYADVSPSHDRITAVNLGHPLISAAERVSNDVTAGPEGTVLLVTGSNMSGKSTLLRSMGANIALAQAGAPACAESLSLPPLALATSMRISDSLEDGVSFFMAELKRLKQIVDLARAYSQPGQNRRLFYLLDEILQGTNTAERQIAVRRVLTHLLSQNALGAISTHDLDLAAAQPLTEACQPVHFRETITSTGGQQKMTFDYQLRQGVAETTNALKLLEMVGLGE